MYFCYIIYNVFLLYPTLNECCVELLIAGFIIFVSSQLRASLLAENHLLIRGRVNAGSVE